MTRSPKPPLSRKQFGDALQKGFGRAMLHVRRFGTNGIEDDILDACLHCRVHEDTKEQYDRPEYRACCFRLAQRIVDQSQQYVNAGHQIVCILGVEGSPSCSVLKVPTRNGPVDGSGVFFEIPLTKLRKADLEVPVVGIPEAADMTEARAQVRRALSIATRAEITSRFRFEAQPAATKNSSRSDLMNVAVGFNPRWEFGRDASVASRRLTRRTRQGIGSVVATRLVSILGLDLRGLKPTVTINSRYAAKTKNSGSYFGPRCYRPRFEHGLNFTHKRSGLSHRG